MRKSALTFFLISLIALALVLIPDFALAQSNNSLAGRIGDPSGFVYQSWRAILAVVNILVIIALLAVSFSNALRLNIDSYQLKKALPKLIIGVLLANASFFIVKFMADISTATLMFIVEQSDESSLAGFIKLAIDRISIETILLIGNFVGPLIWLALLVFGLITAIGLIWLAIILYVRLAYIYFLAIVSPLALLAYGLPGLEKHFRTWWQDLTKWLFILPAMAGVFWVMIQIGADPTQSRSDTSLVQVIIIYVLFFFALGLPKKMGGSIVGDVTNKFKAWTGINAAQGAIKKTWGNEVSYRKKQMGASWGATGAGRYFAGFGAKRAMQNAFLDKKMAISKSRVDIKLESTKEAQKGRMLEWRKKEFENLLKIEKDKFEQENLVTDDEKIKKLRLRMVASDANAEAYSKTVEKLLSKEKGNYATDRFRALEQIFLKADRDKNLAEWQNELRELQKLSADLQSNDTTVYGDATNKLSTLGINTPEELDEKIVEIQYKTSKKYEDKLKAIFDELKVNYGDIKDSSLDDAVKTAQTDKVRKSIWENESKRHKSVMADRDIAMTKDDIEDGNVSLIASSLRDVFKDLGVDIKEELAKGVTHGLNSKQQMEFVQATHAIRKIAENTRSPHSDKALLEMLRIMKENGRNTVKLMNGQQGKIEDLIKEVESGKIDEKKRRNYMQAVGSDKMFSGSPGNRYEKT